MTDKNQSPIRFQLEESIWLDHQARNVEITSLALEPDVEVHEDSGLVTIRGCLVLTGKYETRDEDNGYELDSGSLADQLQFQPLRVDQMEIYQKDYRNKIEKRFPVDVTVPKDKVEDINKVYVHVEQFDYNIEDSHRLEIEANVAISGILTEKEKDVLLEKKNGEFRADTLYPDIDVAATKDDLPQEQSDTPPHLHFYNDNEDKRNSEPEYSRRGEAREDTWGESGRDSRRDRDEEPQVESVSSVNQDTQERFADHNRHDKSSAVNNSKAESHDESQMKAEAERPKLSEKLSQMSAETKVDANAKGEQEESAGFAAAERVEDKHDQNEAENNVLSIIDERIKTSFQATVSGDEEYAEEDSDSKTTVFLAQLMSGRDEEGQDYTRLTMCITQREESLEDIAQRYNLRVSDIMRVNRMQTQEIKEGQILYIPKK